MTVVKLPHGYIHRWTGYWLVSTDSSIFLFSPSSFLFLPVLSFFLHLLFFFQYFPFFPSLFFSFWALSFFFHLFHSTSSSFLFLPAISFYFQFFSSLHLLARKEPSPVMKHETIWLVLGSQLRYHNGLGKRSTMAWAIPNLFSSPLLFFFQGVVMSMICST